MHTDIDIHKTGLVLLRVFAQTTNQLPKEYKRQIGDRLIDGALDILELIRKANATRGNRVPLRDEIIEKLERLKNLLRVAHEIKILADGHWQRTNRLTTSIARQAYGWIK